MLTKTDSQSAPVSAQDISARLERLPITRKLMLTRIIIGAATFFDAYTVLAIAFAMPVLVREWQLTPAQVGMILSFGYLGQLVGAVFFGWLAERIGRLRVLLLTIVLFVAMDVACLFAWSAWSMIAFRFLQGIGTGGEVPVASAYLNEFIGAKRRGRFFLLYEVIFPVGLMFAGLVGYFFVPVYGWKAMFIVGLVPAVLAIPLRWFISESPRWLASKGRLQEADAIVSALERAAIAEGKDLPPPQPVAATAASKRDTDWRELFQGLYGKRTFTIWAMWFCTYMVINGLITWLPTLYREVFKLPLQTSLAYGFTTSACGVVASIACALLIDRVGRKRWYACAFLLGTVPLGVLAMLGADTATHVLVLATLAYAIIQTIAFSLYLYSAELYPTRLRALGTGCGSAWLRLGSSAGPLVVGSIVAGYGIHYVFAIFAGVLVVGALVTSLFAIETKGRVLEQLSP
ncbi:MFS transporter [Bradyrhizobium prioriisuperbiae]|uniref:MFS transporter n=1 Tax=Bradyrhizobium prioriisuperbiae TaxID=2854389 RepID=UPI0028EF7D99|nr:MFS transporter [Bradyrhizobium prioritasuperba]